VSDEKKIYFNENNQNILQSLKFGVLNKTTAKSLVENRYRYNDNNIIILKDRTDAFKQIKDGTIDAYFNDEPILNEMIKSLKLPW
jgi:ABC-type amino acid transport substrate-binding protein